MAINLAINVGDCEALYISVVLYISAPDFRDSVCPVSYLLQLMYQYFFGFLAPENENENELIQSIPNVFFICKYILFPMP